MKIVLIGFMCSGKSTVGRLLARRLGWEFVDTDEMIVKQARASIPEIFRMQGEEAFRSIERTAVQIAAERKKVVISTGGGAPLIEANMRDLKADGEIVWLNVSAETVLKRAGNFASRPLIDKKDPLGSIQMRLAERAPAYSKAQHVVEADALTPSEIVDEILMLIPSLTS